MAKWILISGVSGVIGEGIFKEIVAKHKDEFKIACVFRNINSSKSFFTKFENYKCNVIPIFYDLSTDFDDVIINQIGVEEVDFCLGIHCAADVSWDKAIEQVYPINVLGSINFCKLLLQICSNNHLIYISSAYTSTESWNYRNGYEKSKALAETAIRNKFPEIDISTFSCSLVVGEMADGYISRFHGLYPLFKLLFLLSPPLLVGDVTCRINIVPLNWVIDELFGLCKKHFHKSKPEIVVASGGETQMTLFNLVELLVIYINEYRAKKQLDPIKPIPIIKHRQWGFLKNSLEKWKPNGISINDFKYLIHLLEIYRPYTVSDTVRPPLNVQNQAPNFEDYYSVILDYWVQEHETLISRKLR